MTKLTAIDLFAGAGGLSDGLRAVGFSVLAASELVDIYADTHQANHPETVQYRGDIRDLAVETVLRDTRLVPGELDLLAGGPPCQGFSINAPVRSMDDHRNHLFLEFLRLIDGLQPKTVLIENVPGIISMGGGWVIKSIYTALAELGYRGHHKILFAAHYGVPQMRWRTIILASRDDTPLPQFPEPTHRAKGVANFTGSRELVFKLPPSSPLFPDRLAPQMTVADAISDLMPLSSGEGLDEMDYPGPAETDYQQRLRDGAQRLYNHRAARLHAVNRERLQHIPPGGSWRDIPFDLLPAGMKRARRSDHTKRYGRLHPDGMASTILTKCDPHWGSFFHYAEDRLITVREAARFQSFPDSFRFLGTLVQQYQQVGNAVPPLLGTVLGLQVKTAIAQAHEPIAVGAVAE